MDDSCNTSRRSITSGGGDDIQVEVQVVVEAVAQEQVKLLQGSGSGK